MEPSEPVRTRVDSAAPASVRPSRVLPAGGRVVDWNDYLRDQAAQYRRMAEEADDQTLREELLELADVAEEVAEHIEQKKTGG